MKLSHILFYFKDFGFIEIWLKGNLRTITANARSCARESFKSSTIQRSNVDFALILGKVYLADRHLQIEATTLLFDKIAKVLVCLQSKKEKKKSSFLTSKDFAVKL